MRRVLAAVIAASAIAAAALLPELTAPPAQAADCVVAVAGDITNSADPTNPTYINALRTGDTVRSINPTYAVAAGDSAYANGTLDEYQTKYDPTWGSFKSITRPIPGNAEYRTTNAQGYYDYFFGGTQQGNVYYGTDCGAWRIYALNCEIACGSSSAQLAWLKSDLAAHPGKHYLGLVHRPRYTSDSGHTPDPTMSPLWRALQAAGGDLFVGGHAHQYERFDKQNADGAADPAGMRQFVVGTGGAPLSPFSTTIQPNSQYRDAKHFGVLKLTLGADSYSWQYIGSGRKDSSMNGQDDPTYPLGTVFDSGTTATNKPASGNTAPVVNAGADTTVTLSDGAALAGSATDDGLPSPPGTVSTSWTKVSGPGTVNFADPTKTTTTATFDTAGTYTLRLTADDSALQSSGEVTITVASTPVAADCVVAVAGDITNSADPTNPTYINALRTGDTVRSINPTYAVAAGDSAYANGTLDEYQTKYDPTWGSFKSITRPIPGNAEYRTTNAQGYYDYFFGGTQQGNVYYGTDCGAWRIYALNCEIACGSSSAQLAWLKSDLAAHPGKHYLGLVHRPRYTSDSGHTPDPTMSPLWRALQAAGGDLFVGGHAHQYERFDKQNADGAADPAGMRQFVVGTGGAPLSPFSTTIQPNSQYRDAKHFGVLKLTLGADSYSWQYIGSGRKDSSMNGQDDPTYPLGTVFDSGTTATNKPAPPS